MKPLRYSFFFRFVRFFARLFGKKYTSRVEDFDGPAVFVCRHLNLHGPMTLMKWLKIPFRPMVLNVFFRYTDCRRQYKDFTFSKRAGMPRPVATVLATIAASAVAPLVRGVRAIPVYRGKTKKVFETFQKSLAALENGDKIAVFPDVEYTADSGHKSDIYTGFLSLDKYYYAKEKKHIPFIVLTVDDEKREIRASEPIFFPDDVPFVEAAVTVKENLMHHLYPEERGNA